MDSQLFEDYDGGNDLNWYQQFGPEWDDIFLEITMLPEVYG